MPIPNDLRQMNRRQLLLASLKSGPATRSTLAKATGISQPTTGKIIEELIGDGVLRETETVIKSRKAGRPGNFVKVDDVQPRFLGVQLGAARTTLASLTIAPILQDVWNKTIPTPNSVDAWIEAVVDAARPLLREQTTGVLLSVPGILDEATGMTLLSPHARWAEGQALAARLEEAIDLPAHAVQEIQCLAVGHRVVNPSCDSFLLIDFGIGIGSASMVRGSVQRGPRPFAGELGHTAVHGEMTLCKCGGIGCLETVMGRHQVFGIAHSEGDADVLTPAESDALKNPAVYARVRRGLEAAGFAIAAAMNVQGFDHAVVTGFVADLPPELFSVLRNSVAASAVASRFGHVRVDAVPRHRMAGLASIGIDRMIVPA
ncbi:MAG: ROK family protein [Tepidisphaeraceae bacterium]